MNMVYSLILLGANLSTHNVVYSLILLVAYKAGDKKLYSTNTIRNIIIVRKWSEHALYYSGFCYI